MSDVNTGMNINPAALSGSTTAYWTDSPQWGAKAASELEPVRSLPRFILLHGTVLEPDELVLRVKYIGYVGSAERGALVEYQRAKKVEQYRVTETPAQILALINGESIELDDE